MSMRAVDIRGGAGPRTALFINENVPRPTPSATQALVKVHAFGINRMDLSQREGHYPVPPHAPKTMGVEFSGVIAELGADAAAGDETPFRVGDEVFGLAYGGAYAEYIAVSSRMLLHKPKFLSFEVAAGIPETWITALQALHLVGEFAAGKSILWHAGASSVSIAGIQLSRALGASAIYATAGTDEKCAFLTKKFGVDAAFNYKKEDWAKAILERTDGRGVDVIIDFVAANYFQNNINVAARDGRIVMLALLSGGKVSEVDISAILRKRIRIEGSGLRSHDLDYQSKLRDLLEGHLADFESGKLEVVVDKVLPWEEIQEAHALLEENKTSGKIICTIA